MKKTLRTVLTAAMFAAANMSALPTSAEENNAEENIPQQKWGALISWSDSDWNDAERATGQFGQNVYGPGPNYDLNDHSHDWSQGGWKLPDEQEETVTTTADNQKTTTTTTTPLLTTLISSTTTTMQMLYGPDMIDSVRPKYLGDVNLDETVDSFDMIALRRMILNGLGDASRMNVSLFNSDVNLDGKVNIADLILLQKYLLGQIDEIEAEGTGSFFPTVERITEPPETRPPRKTQTTTTTSKTTTTEAVVSAYDPREDIVVSLYGIKPAKDIIDQSIFETKENIEIQLSSEDE